MLLTQMHIATYLLWAGYLFPSLNRNSEMLLSADYLDSILGLLQRMYKILPLQRNEREKSIISFFSHAQSKSALLCFSEAIFHCLLKLCLGLSCCVFDSPQKQHTLIFPKWYTSTQVLLSEIFHQWAAWFLNLKIWIWLVWVLVDFSIYLPRTRKVAFPAFIFTRNLPSP